MQQMYDAKCKEYEELVEQFNQLQDEDQALINELEEKLHNTETKLAQAQNRQIYLQDDLKKLKNESSSQILKLEKQISHKDEQIEQLQLKLNQLNRKIVEFEIDADSHESRQRQLYEANRDLEVKLDRVLEQLAMVQTDLEIQKNNGQDQIERLKMEIKDYQDELLATKRQRMSSCTSMASVPEYAKLYQSIATVDTVRANAAGFNKSLTLISALIKDLDDKMTQIRVQKV